MMQNQALRQDGTTLQDWSLLSDEQQVALSQQALVHATLTLAGQAERLACAIEAGDLADRGGPEALRLLARLLAQAGPTEAVGGHA